jgi:hypothetical protein
VIFERFRSATESQIFHDLVKFASRAKFLNTSAGKFQKEILKTIRLKANTSLRLTLPSLRT